jgi:hypothetical protein
VVGWEAVILAARELPQPFTEWDLTVAAHFLCPQLFGMRGYSHLPDHKRVYLELIGGRQRNAITRGYIERAGPNLLKLTALGAAHAARLEDPKRAEALYAAVELFVQHPALLAWIADPAQPSEHRAFESFLGESSAAAVHNAVNHAQQWLKAKRCEHLARALTTHGSSKLIGYAELAHVDDFVRAMEVRFKHRAKASARPGATRS